MSEYEVYILNFPKSLFRDLKNTMFFTQLSTEISQVRKILYIYFSKVIVNKYTYVKIANF